MVRELTVRVSESGADAERLDEVTRFVRRELLELDIGDVTALRTGAPPPGARAIDAIAMGGLLVTLGQSASSIAPVVSALRNWLARGSGPRRTVRLEIEGDVLELSEASVTEQTRLIDMFVSRHTGNEGAP